MILYRHHSGKLNVVAQKAFAHQDELQDLFEQNLEELLGLELVGSRLSINGKRIDTLAFDHQRHCFVIIDYISDEHSCTSGDSSQYLDLMQQKGAAVLSKYQQELPAGTVSRGFGRIIFVASAFSEKQLAVKQLKDIDIELWEVKRYADDSLLIGPVKQLLSEKNLAALKNGHSSLADGLVVTADIAAAGVDSGALDYLQQAFSSLADLFSGFDIGID